MVEGAAVEAVIFRIDLHDVPARWLAEQDAKGGAGAGKIDREPSAGAVRNFFVIEPVGEPDIRSNLSPHLFNDRAIQESLGRSVPTKLDQTMRIKETTGRIFSSRQLPPLGRLRVGRNGELIGFFQITEVNGSDLGSAPLANVGKLPVGGLMGIGQGSKQPRREFFWNQPGKHRSPS